MSRGSIFITAAICVGSLSACDTFKDKYLYDSNANNNIAVNRMLEAQRCKVHSRKTYFFSHATT